MAMIMIWSISCADECTISMPTGRHKCGSRVQWKGDGFTVARRDSSRFRLVSPGKVRVELIDYTGGPLYPPVAI
jgi:hypothetical protein